jgi:hypothetical protein
VKRSTIFLTALAATLYLGSIPLLAQHVGGHAGEASPGSPGPSASRDDGAKGSKSEAGSGTPTSAGMTVSQHLQHNAKLASKLESLLGMNGAVNGLSPLQQLQGDATGFNNLGQFVAAVHVSHNLDIPFDQLRAKVVGPPAETLGKAIQFFKPEADSKAETRKARKQANNDVKESGSES